MVYTTDMFCSHLLFLFSYLDPFPIWAYHQMSCDMIPRARTIFSYPDLARKRMESTYFSSLDHLARKRHLVKLQIDGEVFLDPYGIDEKDWINDVTTWPDLQFGDIFIHISHSYEGNIHTGNSEGFQVT